MDARLAKFREGFAGEIVTPEHAGYDDARRVWNAVYDRRPAAIVRPTDTAGVAAAIRFARDLDLEIAVRGGGHSASGHSTCDGGLVIDLSAMRGVTVDAAANRARANGGALLAELDRAGQAYGLVCPVGVIGHTGVAGLTLGGGVGRLQRHFGLTIDHVRAIELVTADGRHVRASGDEEPELFWGMRGAGWNFGVATAFEFDLVPFGGTLHRGTRIYRASQANEVWELFRDFAPTAPEALSMILAIGRAEPGGEYPPGVAGGPIVIIGYNHSGRAEDAESDLAPLRRGPEPVASTHVSQPYLEVQVANDDASGWGSRGIIHGLYANDIEPGSMDRLIAHVARGTGESSFSITAQGGTIAQVSDDAMAFQGRAARFDLSADSAWTDPGDDAAQRAWASEAMAIVEPFAIEGRYVNENADDGPDATRRIYGEAKIGQLTALKQAWDPDNIFHLNHNVVP